LRRGGFEGLADKLLLPDYRPDFGPRRPHRTAGASIVGARSLLVAWNVLIAPLAPVASSEDCARAARAVARAVRESSGGLAAVRAIGVWLERRGLAQVSLNLLDTDRTPMTVAFDRVDQEASARGFRVVETELIGLAAKRALPEDPGTRIRLRATHDPVLEQALERAGLLR
jgi:glutamate formiminotransferase